MLLLGSSRHTALMSHQFDAHCKYATEEQWVFGKVCVRRAKATLRAAETLGKSDVMRSMLIDIAFMLRAGLGTGFAINVGTRMPCGHVCGIGVGSVLLLRTLLPSGTGMRPAIALRSGSVVARPSGRFWFCA